MDTTDTRRIDDTLDCFFSAQVERIEDLVKADTRSERWARNARREVLDEMTTDMQLGRLFKVGHAIGKRRLTLAQLDGERD